MLTAFILAALAITGTELPEPVYELEYPAVGFELLPQELSPPVEGTLTEEAGVISSSPGPDGIEYQLYYWQEELEDNTRKDIWLAERFNDIIPPDLMPSLLVGNVNWMEGSTASARRETSSIGLVPALNFNVIDSSGNIVGRGRACAIFPEGYSILFYGIAPDESGVNMPGVLDAIVAHMYLLGG